MSQRPCKYHSFPPNGMGKWKLGCSCFEWMSRWEKIQRQGRLYIAKLMLEGCWIEEKVRAVLSFVQIIKRFHGRRGRGFIATLLCFWFKIVKEESFFPVSLRPVELQTFWSDLERSARMSLRWLEDWCGYVDRGHQWGANQKAKTGRKML